MAMKQFMAVVVALFVMALDAPVMAAATGSDDSGGSESPTKYERAVDLIESSGYEKALRILEKLNREDPGNADVLNMLGYANRKLGRLEPALGFYREALAIEPRHLGANEYLGELYLQTDELAKAEERLAELAAACPSGCEEREELAEAIDAYKSEHGLE
jgi:predicted Zn-dependent protease